MTWLGEVMTWALFLLPLVQVCLSAGEAGADGLSVRSRGEPGPAEDLGAREVRGGQRNLLLQADPGTGGLEIAVLGLGDPKLFSYV